MRRFLYITPYFPPQARVGALRPLKFARRLPDHGWAPVILCDLWPGARINPKLLETVPESSAVIRDYSARAAKAQTSIHTRPPDNARGPKPPSWVERWLPPWLRNPELIPLGEHSVHIPYALRAARRALKAWPQCEAIMVNADPYAALLVGAQLAMETGLPLIQDLRDPWSMCELRRPRRPWPMREIVDRLERWAFAPASRVILNTETTLSDYRAHYPDVASQRLACIRNHHDRQLIDQGQHPGFDRFTLLFLGNFRRFVEGDVLLNVLAALNAQGLGDQLQLVVTGECPEATWQMARQLGVADMLHTHPFVPYTEIAAIMEAADVLVSLNNRTRQRIPAKFYDYATTRRPILALADNPELARMVDGSGGQLFGLDEPQAVAQWLASMIQQGRRPEVSQRTLDLSSELATARLVEHLEAVTAPDAPRPQGDGQPQWRRTLAAHRAPPTPSTHTTGETP